MTRTPQARYIADLRFAVEIGAANETEAQERLNAALDFLRSRTDRTTFQRLAGRPTVEVADIISDVVSA